jgi:SsrA-binding protein
VGILIIAENRKARHDYVILDTFEAGLVLTGSEVKSLRNRQCLLMDSYISFSGANAYLQNAHISVYKAGGPYNHDPERKRRILLHRHELDKLFGQMREKGLSCVPLKVYFKKGLAKVELALVKGKKAHDKRQSIKTREVNREMHRRVQKSRS